MHEYESSLILFAELALGLAGFAGVAAAFAGPSRSYGPLEMSRLSGLFFNSGLTLGGSVLLLTLAAAGVKTELAFTTLSIVALVFMIVAGAVGLPPAYRAAEQRWAVHASALTTGVLALVYGSNVWLGGEAWPVLAAFSWQLLYGLWLFTRILTRAD